MGDMAEYDAEYEKKMAAELDVWLGERGLILNVNIVKIPAKMPDGNWYWLDRGLIDLKKKPKEASKIVVPDSNPALQKIAMEVIKGGKTG